MPKVRNYVTYIKSADAVAKETVQVTKKVVAEKRKEDPAEAKAVLEKNTKGEVNLAK